ncbi:MAG: Maf family protein, partial [Candidatus Omnitrophica bacterium]|nr:Maf family protein [Candidatus Omnitrophota bacterium]
LVLFKNKIIGKVFSKKEAKELLKNFNGKKLAVYTGLYLIDKEKDIRISDYDKTTVYIRKFKPQKISRYLKYLGPFDKAGGFSIDSTGAVLFDNIKGSYFNVLGLPLRKLALLLEKIGLDIFDFIRK